jgi:hypothetical protein
MIAFFARIFLLSFAISPAGEYKSKLLRLMVAQVSGLLS